MQKIFRILMAVVMTIMSAVMAAAFSAAIAGTLFDPTNLVELGTSNLAIQRHIHDAKCKATNVSPTTIIVSGPCFKQPEEACSYLVFENGRLVYLKQKFLGKTVVEEKMRAFRAMLGAPHEHQGSKTWSIGFDANSFKYENDGWLIVKRRTTTPIVY